MRIKTLIESLERYKFTKDLLTQTNIILKEIKDTSPPSVLMLNMGAKNICVDAELFEKYEP